MLTPLQHPLNILRHNLPYTLNLTLRRPQGISLPRLRRTLLDHQLLERSIEARTPVGREIAEIRLGGVKGVEELLLQVGQEAEGDALA